jgi:transposase
MPAPYSMDLRTRVLADCDAGMGTGQVAAKYTVSPAWVRRLKQRRRETGEVQPRKGTPGPKPALAQATADGARLAELAAAEPDLSAAEYKGRLGLGCHHTTVWRGLRRLRLTFKKK